MQNFMTVQEASTWATRYLKKNVSSANISYLIQYGRVPRKQENGTVFISRSDLKSYYDAYLDGKERDWKKKLGGGLSRQLSFAEYNESETTKHVHRLHPYKGKFIPQMVEYFLGDHIDPFKKHVFFQKGDIVLDPFCGSGTTLVQANELGLHAVGVDISIFNALLSNIKIGSYNIRAAQEAIAWITERLKNFQRTRNNIQFEEDLLKKLSDYNNKFFPAPEYRRKVYQQMIDEQRYAEEKSHEFSQKYKKLIEKYRIRLRQERGESFLDKWYLAVIREEIDFVCRQVESLGNGKIKELMKLILSRTVHSCRATTHTDLATLKEPVITTYYCRKHGKICKPLFSILGWWKRYSQDTIDRLCQFQELKTPTRQKCLLGDSRTINIAQALGRKSKPLANLVKEQAIAGIFSSPPYVGLIDYHDQHAYAYDLFGMERRDAREIGPLYKGQGVAARQSYVEGIATVLNNCKKYLKADYNIFLVANDKYDLYPQIAKNSGMDIVNQYKRPVQNRVEKDRAAYAETIFHMKARR